MFIKPKKRRLAQVFSVLIGMLCLTAFFLRNYIVLLTQWKYFPTCFFYKTTGYLCPACGNTRAVLALLHGNVLRSLIYNPMILTLTVVLAGLYAEMVCYAFGKRVRILPRSNALLFAVIGIVVGYDIIRNFVPIMKAMF